MKILYKSLRVGKNGKLFMMLKFRTLKEGSDVSQFGGEYTKFGKFLRKYKFDEIPQIWNILKGDMAIVGPRPEEERTIAFYPAHIREKLLSIKPGWINLSGIYFYDEEKILSNSPRPSEDFWVKIKPIKIALEFFYIENKCWSFDIIIIWLGFKRFIKEFFRK